MSTKGGLKGRAALFLRRLSSFNFFTSFKESEPGAALKNMPSLFSPFLKSTAPGLQS